MEAIKYPQKHQLLRSLNDYFLLLPPEPSIMLNSGYDVQEWKEEGKELYQRKPQYRKPIHSQPQI